VKHKRTTQQYEPNIEDGSLIHQPSVYKIISRKLAINKPDTVEKYLFQRRVLLFPNKVKVNNFTWKTH